MQVRTIIIVEGLANLVTMMAKLWVGLSTNSAAIVGDAMHSLTDFSNNIIAFLALRISEKPPDSDHHYGHAKYQQLAVFAIAVMLAVVAVELLLNAVSNYGQVVSHSRIGLIILALTLTINIGLTVWPHYWAKRLDSDLLQADAKHTVSDVLTTFAVIAGWQLAARGYAFFDTVVAILIALIILYMMVKLFLGAIPILVDYSRYKPEEMKRVVQGIDHVEAVQQVRARSARNGGSADVTVTVDATLTMAQAHAVTELIEQALLAHFGFDDVVVHVEPDYQNCMIKFFVSRVYVVAYADIMSIEGSEY
jgi:cation diffusion facilitator family transporter